MNFQSFSEAKRFAAQTKGKNLCQHAVATPGLPFMAPLLKPCGKPAFAGARHGWLCEEHYRQEEQQIASQRRHIENDHDADIIASVIATDSTAILYGKVRRVRFGAVEPIYLSYLE